MANKFTLHNAVAPAYQPRGNSAIDLLNGFFEGRENGRVKAEEQRRWEIENRRKDVNSAQLQRQNDILDRRDAATEKRDALTYERQTAERRGKQVGDLLKLGAAGRDTEAEAYAAASAYEGPDGTVQTLGYDKGDPGEEGVSGAALAEFTKTLPLWGKKTTAQAGDMGMGREPAAETPGEFDGFAKTFGARAARGKAVIMPGGERKEIDPAEGPRYQQDQANLKRDQLMALVADKTLPEDLRRSIALQAGLTGAQASGAERAAIGGRDSQEDAQAANAAEGQADRDARARLKLMGAAKGPKAPKAADVRGDKRLGMQEEGGARVLAGDVLRTLGFKESQVQNRKFNDMVSNLTVDPNAALDAVTAGSFVKMAQGGSGVLSDADMKQFWQSIGGVTDKSAQWIQGVISGEIEPEKREKVLAAVRQLAGEAQARLDTTQSALEHAFRSSPNYSRYEGQFVGTYFPRARQQAAAPGGGAVAPAGAPGGGKTAALQKAIAAARRDGREDVAKELEARLKSTK